VKHTRAASKDRLKELLRKRIQIFNRNGTTLVEAKSGYGLETATELKMLQGLKKKEFF